MRRYYVKSIKDYNECFKYVKLYYRDFEDIYLEIVIGDLDDSKYKLEFESEEIINFVEHNEVLGCRTLIDAHDHQILELMVYIQELHEFNMFIEGYEKVNSDISIHKGYRYIGIDAESFKHGYFDIKKNFIRTDNEMPITVSDYIVNYAKSEDFSPDLQYVNCVLWGIGVVRFTLNSEGRALLAKLRLLR